VGSLACMTRFPVNPTYTLTQADALVSFIRKKGAVAAVNQCHYLGMGKRAMISFMERNREMWDFPKDVA